MDVHMPRWAGKFYAVMGLLLIPWVYELAETLPARHIAKHWDVLWSGFDIFMLLLILLTAFLIVRKSLWVIVTGSALGTVFLVDAWFDTLTSGSGLQFSRAVIMDVIEIVLAIITYRLVFVTIHQTIHQSAQKRGKA